MRGSRDAAACQNEVLNPLLGGANRVFLPVLIDDTKSHQGTVKAGQNGNQGEHAGMKHDQTEQMNGGIITPSVGEMEAE